MKDIIKLGVILMVYSAVAGLFLGWVNNATDPKIREQKRLEIETAIKEVLPASATFFETKTFPSTDGKSQDTVFIGYSDSTKQTIIGFAAMAKGSGFSSTISTMVGLNVDMSINAIKVISQSETPGLGTKLVEPEFITQFPSKNSEQLAVDKDGGTIKSITGATISSRACTNSIKALITKLSKLPELKPAIPDSTTSDSTALAQSV